MGNVAVVGGSYFDLLTGAMGAYMYMIVWNVLKMSGFVFLAFLAVIVEALKENYEGDQLNDEPHQQLGRLKVRLVVMVFIVLFVAMPTLDVTSLKLRVPVRQCDAPVMVSQTGGLLLNEEQWSYLQAYGGKKLYNKERDALQERGVRNPHDVLISTMFDSELQQYYNDMLYSSWDLLIPRVAAIETIDRALASSREQEQLKDLGLTLEAMGEVIRVPIWWQMIRSYMLGTNAAIVAKIPCEDGFRIAKADMEADFISSPSLKAEFIDFYEQCHVPSLQEWKQDKKEARTERGFSGVDGEQLIGGLEVVSVPGNPILLNSYYPSRRSKTPVRGFGGTVSEENGYDGDPDAAGSGKPAVDGMAGYPTCDWWWRHPLDGLEQKLIKYWDLDTDKGKLATLKLYRIPNEERMLQKVLAKKLFSDSLASKKAAIEIMDKLQGSYVASHEFTDESDHLGTQLLGLAVDFGTITSYAERMAGLSALLRAMPTATALLIMFYQAMLPVGLVIGRFQVGPVMGLTISYVGFFLWAPYFRLVKWIDDNLMSLMDLQDVDTVKMAIDMMIGAAYIAVPTMVTGIITMAGIRISSFDPIGGSTLGSIGSGGVTTLTNIGKFAGKQALRTFTK